MKLSITYCILVLATISIIFISGCGSQTSEGNSQGAGEENAIPPTVSGSCPSKYDGTYQGIFTYEYYVTSEDEAGVRSEKIETSGFRLTATLECVSVSDNVWLNVSHVIASHPDFGCQVGGCVPQSGYVILPLEDTKLGTPDIGDIMLIFFPNGAMLTTSPIVVSVDGMVLSGSPDPALGGQAYMVGEAPGAEYVFPSEGWGKDELYRSFSAKSWTLSKTT